MSQSRIAIIALLLLLATACFADRAQDLFEEANKALQAKDYAVSAAKFLDAADWLRMNSTVENEAMAYRNAAYAYHQAGNTDREVQCLSTAVTVLSRPNKCETPFGALICYEFGLGLMKQQKYANAEGWLLGAYRNGRTDGDTLRTTNYIHRAIVLPALGDDYVGQKKLDKAIERYKEATTALAPFPAALGMISYCYQQLAAIADEQQKPDDADANLRSAIKLIEEKKSKDDPLLRVPLTRVIQGRYSRKQYAECVPLGEQLVTVLLKTEKPEAKDVLEIRLMLAAVDVLVVKDYIKAEAHANAVIEALKATPEHPQHARALRTLAEVMRHTDRTVQAAIVDDQAQAIEDRLAAKDAAAKETPKAP
jgi:tetratricopeptide (TPR) repeat protein